MRIPDFYINNLPWFEVPQMTLDSTHPAEGHDDIYESRAEEEDYGSDVSIEYEDEDDKDKDPDWV